LRAWRCPIVATMIATVMTTTGTWADGTAEPDSAAADARGEVLRLFAAHGQALYRFCCFTLGSRDDAEDVVQETFLRLLQHLQSAGGRSNLRAWLFTVAANACRDRARWRARFVPWHAEHDRRTIEPREEAPDRKRALGALRSLAPRDRLLLSLRAQGLSYREVAAAAGIEERSVGRLLARAVDRWRRRIGDRQEH
jgi:RNA polymerase sigma-70 factor, ECF subfamily